MKYIVLNVDSSVLDCLSAPVDGAIEITDEQASVFKSTIQHSEYKYINGELIKNIDYKKPEQPLTDADRIWKALNDAKVPGVVIPDDIKAKLDKVK